MYSARRNHSVYEPSYWEIALHCNAVSHWLVAYTDRFLLSCACCGIDSTLIFQAYFTTLQWRHNGRDSVSNHQPHDCFLNRLFRHSSKKTSKLRVTGLCAGNSPGTGEFPAQMTSNAENVSIWWRHHESRTSKAILKIHSTFNSRQLHINCLVLLTVFINDFNFTHREKPHNV